MSIRLVRKDIKIELTLTFSAYEATDENGTDLEDVGLETIDVAGEQFVQWPDAIAYMNKLVDRDGDWANE